jgi:Tol biopolymer transport system component
MVGSTGRARARVARARRMAFVACFAASGALAQSSSITLLQHTPAPSVVGQGIVVTSRLDTSGSTQLPTGTITIGDGIDRCVAHLPEGFCLFIPRTPGDKVLTARYLGDGTFPPAVSAPVPHTIKSVVPPERLTLGPARPSWLGGYGGGPTFSADGRFLAFSINNALLPEDTGCCDNDVYVMDRQTLALELISVNSAGSKANNGAGGGPGTIAISADGRFVAFTSGSSNLVAGDTNNFSDIFVRDRLAGTTVRASVGASGTQSNGEVFEVDISGDGQRVAFSTNATNLVAADTSASPDVYLRDLQAGTTTLVSVTPGGTSSGGPNYYPTISDDGTRVAFNAAGNMVAAPDLTPSDSDVYVRNVDASTTERATVDGAGVQRGGATDYTQISGDGERVLFRTYANHDPLDTNGQFDWYVRDLAAGTTLLASQRDDDAGPSASAVGPGAAFGPGNSVYFLHPGSDLVADGDAGAMDLFLRDLAAGTTERLTAGAPDGVQPDNIASSSDGSSVVMLVFNSALLKVGNVASAIYNANSGTFSGFYLDPRGNQLESAPAGQANAVSADGRYVVFSVDSARIDEEKLGNNNELYLRDRATGTLERVCLSDDDKPASGHCYTPAMSADARFVAFRSDAANLVVPDGNGQPDIFLRDRLLGTTVRVSVDGIGTDANGPSYQPAISPDGRFVAFTSEATNLVPGDSNGRKDVFVWDRLAPALTAIRRASVAGVATQSNGHSVEPSVSADGTRVAFLSEATNLSATGSGVQAYLRDFSAQTTVQVSATSAGGQPNGTADQPELSADGAYVAFTSTATNLDPAQPCCVSRYLVRYRVADGARQFAEVASAPVVPGDLSPEATPFSSDGRYFAFETSGAYSPLDANPGQDLYVYDFERGAAGLVSLGANGATGDLSAFGGSIALAGDGAQLVFSSGSADLSIGDTNGVADVFFTRNPVFGLEATQQVEAASSEAVDGSRIPSVTADGRYVVFESDADNLVAGDTNGATDVYRVDTLTGSRIRISLDEDEAELAGAATEPAVNVDGTLVAFVAADAAVMKVRGETKAEAKRRKGAGTFGVFMRNMITGTTQRMATAQPGGNGTRPRIAPGGNALVFATGANLAPGGTDTNGRSDVYVRPLGPGPLRCVTCKAVDAGGNDTGVDSDGDSLNPVVSASGTRIAYETTAKNTVPGAPDPNPGPGILLRDLVTGAVQRISRPQGGSATPGANTQPSMDYSGRNIVFQSTQPLVPGDTGGNSQDIYLYDLDLQRLERVSVDAGGGEAGSDVSLPAISGDGRSVSFVSDSTALDSLTPGTPGVRDVFVRSLASRQVRRLSSTRRGGLANGDSFRPAFGYGGQSVAFDSVASNLADNDTNGAVSDVFVRANPLTVEQVFGAGFE